MKVKNRSKIIINDNLFHQTISCPLKFFHIAQNTKSRGPLPFKQRNKLMLRDAVAQRFQNVKFTSDETVKAARETEVWLQEKVVTICGAVIEWNNYRTRIPVLVKNGSEFTIVQIHGKLRKRSQSDHINTAGRSKQSAVYLLKASYRLQILKNVMPEYSINVHFYFPERGFISSTDELFTKAVENSIDQEVQNDLNNLFARVDATEGVHQVLTSIPGIVSHSHFAGSSVPEALLKVEDLQKQDPDRLDVSIHSECNHCMFRKKNEIEAPGCWSRYFVEPSIVNADQHVYDLIGHGNENESENGYYFQEQIPVPDHFAAFDQIKKSTGNTITIQQRRYLQLLKAKGKPGPKIWAKKGLNSLNQLTFPLHFIDFEASTFALPMNRHGGPYQSVYFQFSCHTMDSEGNLTHYEWLDDKPGSAYPHRNFVHNLAGIDGIFEGTIIQYSPFEVQAINHLIREFDKNSMIHEEELDILNRIRMSQNGKDAHRFFDLSKLVSQYYFNSFIQGGLGLKDVMNGILNYIESEESADSYQVDLAGLKMNLLENVNGERINPYRRIQNSEYNIVDGSEAMNAYMALKSGRVSDDERELIPTLLRRYCALDSYGQVILYHHLNKIAGSMDGENFIHY
jgi:hypothetical protein